MLEIIKAIVYGIVEGITEWLPISSPGHLILVERLIPFQETSNGFFQMFDVVIQLGAILAVVVLFFHKLNPFAGDKTAPEKKSTWNLWAKVVVSIIPSGVVGVLFDDWMDAHLHTAPVVAAMLIVYGVAFLLVERRYQGRHLAVDTVDHMDWRTAVGIGLFQCLSLIPGTSRSGSTILGGIFLGASRSAAAEFSFFMAIPTMLGASGIKLLKFFLTGVGFAGGELAVLLIGCAVSFLVSLLVIRGLMSYVRNHSFSVFGVYRIVLGVIVLAYFALVK